MRNFRVVAMSVIYGIVFPFTNVGCKRLFTVRTSTAISMAIVLDKVIQEGVRASRIVRRVGKGKDVFV